MYSATWASAMLLAGGLLDGQPGITPKLESGREIVWAGTFTEEAVQSGSSQTRQRFQVEHRLLVLPQQSTHTEATLFSRFDLITEGTEEKPSPIVRLERIRWLANGQVEVWANGRDRWIRLSSQFQEDLPTLELSFFMADLPAWIEPGSEWEIPSSPNFTHWRTNELVSERGQRCWQIDGWRQSIDWTAPRGPNLAYRQLERVWLSLTLGYAIRLDRTTEVRDPSTQDVIRRNRLEISQKQTMQFRGSALNDRLAEIEMSLLGMRLLQRAMPNAGRLDSPFQRLLDQLAGHELEHPVGESIPYRALVNSLERRCEAVMKGQPILLPKLTEPPTTISMPLLEGAFAPDFLAKTVDGTRSIRLMKLRGKPTLLLYFEPNGPSSQEALEQWGRWASTLSQKMHFLAVNLGKSANFASLPVLLLDGSDVLKTHRIDSTPQIVWVDEEGIVRHRFLGWGPDVYQAILRLTKPNNGVLLPVSAIESPRK
jgi:hypothetical protein